jgi:hypothetical protein
MDSIVKVIKHGENCLLFTRRNFLNFLDRSKILAMKMHKKRQSDEHYLGRSSFSDELHCSVNEFITFNVSALGYLPLRLQFMGEQ